MGKDKEFGTFKILSLLYQSHQAAYDELNT